MAHWAISGVTEFWTSPHPSRVALFAPDGMSYWPGKAEPARGREGHRERIAAIVGLVPDIRIELVEHAVQGELVFFRWIARGTGKRGPFEITGVDRLRVRESDRQIVETMVLFDTALFEERVGAPVPYL